MLTAVSLFSGVGGFDLVLERNGVKVVATCEIDKHAQKVLTRHFPTTKLFTDVTTLTGKDLLDAGFNPTNGIITGGFPCQDVSVAGKRAGFTNDDGTHTRSGLFWHIARLLDETKTKYFILENVPGLLSSNSGRDMGTVLGTLVDLGYGVAYRILDAQYFGVPQRRRRVFVVGCFGDDGGASSEILAISEGRERYLAQSAPKRKDVAGTLGGGSGNRGWPSDPERMTFVPVGILGDISHSLTAEGSDASEDGTGRGTPVVTYRKSRRAQTNTDHETWVSSSVTNTLNAFDMGDTRATELVTYPIDDAREIEKHQNGTGIGISGAPAFTLDTRQHPAIAFHQKQNPISGEVSPTLGTTSGGMGVLASVVRRLTPTECERLQGFPDDWTDGQTDFHRYKQMGNAVCVPVVDFIVKRLVRFL